MFDHFGGEDSGSLDESESLKPSKTCDDDVPEWVDAEFNGDFKFKTDQEEESNIKNEIKNNSNNPFESDDELALVSIGSRQEVLLAREESLQHSDEWSYWLVDSGSTTHIDLTTEGMIDVMKLEKGEDQVRVGNKKWVDVIARGTRRLVTEENAIFELENTGVIPVFAKKIISGGRLLEKGNKIVMEGKESFIENKQGHRLKLVRRPDGMLYLKAKIVNGNKRGEVNSMEDNRAKKVRFIEKLEVGPHTTRLVDELDMKNPKSILKATDEKQTTTKKKPMTMDALHILWAHASEKYIKTTAQELGIKTIGKLSPCFGCAQAKARQKNTSKEAKNPATKPGERFFLDLSGPFAPSIAGSKYWLKMVDEFSNKSFDKYIKTKDQLPEEVRKLLTMLFGKGYEVKFLRCDNGGENISPELKGICEGGLGNGRFVQIEYTSRDTPQHNGIVERRFATDGQRALAMMLDRNWSEATRHRMWCEATNLASQVNNNLIRPDTKKSPNMIFQQKQDLFFDYEKMQPFGRIGYVAKRLKFQKKFTPKAFPMSFIGYPENHASDNYKMYNHVTRQAVITRDISKWEEFNREVISEVVPLFDAELIAEQKLMKLMKNAEEITGAKGIEFDDDEVDEAELDAITRLQSENTANGGPNLIPDDDSDDEESIPTLGQRIVDDDDSDDNEDAHAVGHHVISDGEEEADRLSDDDDDDSDNAANFETDDDDEHDNNKVHRELAKLDADINDIDLNEGIRTRNRAYVVDVVTDEVVFNAEAVNSDGDAPKTFFAATKSQLRKYWIKAARREIDNFMKRGAWKKVKRSTLPKGKRPLKVKWVFKIKENETGDERYKGRIVIKGYTEIPGVDYTESFAPVATTSSINMVIANGLYREETEGWEIETLDIEAAFLESDMDPNMIVFIDWPDGMVELDYITEEIKEEYCIQLNAPMYGKVDVPLMFKRTLTKQLKAIGCYESKVDPCVHCVKENGKVVLVGATTVDDILVAGRPEAIQRYKEGLQKRFTIKELGPLKRHLQINYERRKDADGNPFYVLSLPNMKEEIVRKYESFAKKEINESTTPGYPRKHLVKYDGDPLELDTYRSIVGKVLYYAKKVAPEMNNAVRELAQFLSKPGPEHWKALERCVGYVKSNRFNGELWITKPKELRIVSGADSNHGTDSGDRKSIMSEVHTLGGAYLMSSSKKIPSVTLSSTESEYYSNSNAATEMKFEWMLLDEIFLHDDEKRLTGWLYNDNLGALYLSKNQHVSMRTKHIDIRAHYVRELQDKEIIKILFEKSENLLPDMLNKNLPEEDHLRHAENLLRGSMICWREDVGEDGLRRLAFVQRNQRSKTKSGSGTQGGGGMTQSSTLAGPDENHLEKRSQDEEKWITVANKKSPKRNKL
jgi:hypothetical protein